MPRFLLDTNVVIAFLNGADVPLRGRVLHTPSEDVALCSVVKSELWYGAAKSRDPAGNRARLSHLFGALVSLPFDDRAAELCGDLRGELARRGQPISVQDSMIAAIALAQDVTLVTRNERELRRVRGLRVSRW